MGSPNEVNMGGYAHAFGKYLEQNHEAECRERSLSVLFKPGKTLKIL